MRKLLPHIPLITILTLVIGFFVMPHTAHAGVGDLVLDSLFGSVNVLYGVLGKIFWWGLIPFASMVFSLLGTIIDLALAMSFERGFYNAEAISLAWGVIRDIANMFFIFILIYEGIKTTLNLGNLVTVRKTITSVIIAALFLNFSLFFTKVIIDVSNVAATWFMQGITNIGGNESVSFSIGSTLGMEKLATKYSSNSEDLKNIGLQSFTTGVLLFALLCIAIYVFFNFLFLVIGRIVSFIFLLITAPIGFVGPMVPMLQDYSKKWWKELNDQAMMLPMFFLMVYLTLFIIDRIQTFLISSSSTDFTPANYIIFIIIIMMLLKSLKVAEDYSGEIGKMVGGFAKQAGGIALGGVAGAGAFAARIGARATVAAIDNDIAKSGKTAFQAFKSTARQNLAAPLPEAAKVWSESGRKALWDATKKTAKKGGWDARDISTGGVTEAVQNVISGKTNMDIGKRGADTDKTNTGAWAGEDLKDGLDDPARPQGTLPNPAPQTIAWLLKKTPPDQVGKLSKKIIQDGFGATPTPGPNRLLSLLEPKHLQEIQKNMSDADRADIRANIMAQPPGAGNDPIDRSQKWLNSNGGAAF